MPKGVHPRTLQESEAATWRISVEKFGNDPKKEDVEAFPDAVIRNLLQHLQSLTIGEPRNDVVHQRAYTPRRAGRSPR